MVYGGEAKGPSHLIHFHRSNRQKFFGARIGGIRLIDDRLVASFGVNRALVLHSRERRQHEQREHRRGDQATESARTPERAIMVTHIESIRGLSDQQYAEASQRLACVDGVNKIELHHVGELKSRICVLPAHVTLTIFTGLASLWPSGGAALSTATTSSKRPSKRNSSLCWSISRECTSPSFSLSRMACKYTHSETILPGGLHSVYN